MSKEFASSLISKSYITISYQGKIKRIRGTAWAARVSPAVANRMVESAKGILLKFLPDVYLYTDHKVNKVN